MKLSRCCSILGTTTNQKRFRWPFQPCTVWHVWTTAILKLNFVYWLSLLKILLTNAYGNVMLFLCRLHNLRQKLLVHLSCRSIKSVMKLCDVCERFWTCLLNESYVSPKVSEWGYGNSKSFMTINVLEI